MNNSIIFHHTRGSKAPAYKVKVSDGICETEYYSAKIHFDTIMRDVTIGAVLFGSIMSSTMFLFITIGGICLLRAC